MERYHPGPAPAGDEEPAHWPEGLIARLLRAVEIRNYLAHHYLHEYFVVTPTAANREAAARELADLSVWVEELIEELDAHVASLGIAGIDTLDPEMRAEIDAMRPTEWLGLPRLEG